MQCTNDPDDTVGVLEVGVAVHESNVDALGENAAMEGRALVIADKEGVGVVPDPQEREEPVVHVEEQGILTEWGCPLLPEGI